MKTLIYKELNERLLGDWKALWHRANYANYVNSPQWFLSVVETFQPKSYVIIATYDKAKLVAIGALVKEKRYGIGVYTTAPSDFVCGLPFLVDIQNRRILNSFAGGIGKVGSIVLDNVAKRDAEAVERAVKNTALTPFSLNFYLEFQNSSSGEVLISNRKKLMHQVRSIEKEFVLKDFSGGETGILKKVFELDSRSRKHKRGYDVFSDKKIMNFFKLLAEKYKEVLKVNILYFRSEPIAYEMGYLISNTYFGNQMAFVDDFSRFSPGKVLIAKLMDSLNTKGVRKFDLGSGDSRLKRSLAKDYSQLYKVVISDNLILRMYINNVYRYRNKTYSLLQRNMTIYSIYRKLRKVVGI